MLSCLDEEVLEHLLAALVNFTSSSAGIHCPLLILEFDPHRSVCPAGVTQRVVIATGNTFAKPIYEIEILGCIDCEESCTCGTCS